MSETDPHNFETLVRAFERAWQQGTFPAIEDFLQQDRSVSQPERHALLLELICIDLEFRWRQAAEHNHASTPLTLHDYAQRLHDLPPSNELPLELIGEEYRARQRWGDRPSHATFAAHFPGREIQIHNLLKQIDLELQNESNDGRRETQIRTTKEPRATQPANRPDPRAPLPYSDYVLKEMIGAGGMGRVYRAWQQSLERSVAVKFLRKSFLNQTEAIERFVAEARTVAKFRHAGIVGVHGLGRTPSGGYFIVMDWIDGPNLARVSENDPISISDAVRWTIQACEAIEHAHQHGIVHCDIKPGNLLLDRDGSVRVTDFGLAQSLANLQLTECTIAGTAAFMAPEQVSPFWGPVGLATDVYGLGAVLYSLLTAQPPHQGRIVADVLARVVSSVPVLEPMTIRREVSVPLNHICLQCLAKSPADQYQNVRELLGAFERLQV